MLNNDTSTQKQARRRAVRPENVALTIDNHAVLNLKIEVSGAVGISQLLDGFERRLAILEDAVPDARDWVNPTRPAGNGAYRRPNGATS